MKSKREIINRILEIKQHIDLIKQLLEEEPYLSEEYEKDLELCDARLQELNFVLPYNSIFTTSYVFLAGSILFLINVITHSVDNGTVSDVILNASFLGWAIIAYIYNKHYN